MVAILLHQGVDTKDLPMSHAIAYVENREGLLESDSAVIARGFHGE